MMDEKLEKYLIEANRFLDSEYCPQHKYSIYLLPIYVKKILLAYIQEHNVDDKVVP